MSEKLRASMLVLSVTCLMVLMRGGARVQMSSELSALQSLRQLVVALKPDPIWMKAEVCQTQTGRASVSQDQRERYQSERKNIQSMLPRNPIEMFLTPGEPEFEDVGKLAVTFGMFAAVWIMFLIFSGLGCLCYVCCCACDCCCPPCKCCRRDYDKKPITKLELNCCLIFMCMASAPLFVMGIWGMAASGELPDSLALIHCAIISMPENLLKGVQTQNGGQWIGVLPLVVKLEAIANGMTANINNINGALGDTSFVSTRETTVTGQIDALPNFANKLVVRPDAVTTQQLNYLIATGPKSDSNSLSGRVNQVAFGQITVVGAMLSGMKSAITSVQPQLATIKSAIETGVDSVKTLANSMVDMYDGLEKDSGTAFNGGAKKAMFQSTNTFFVFMIIMGGINVAFSILIMLTSVKCFRMILHFQWCFMGLLMMIMFLLLAVIYPVSLVMFEFCELLQGIVKSEAYLNKLSLGDTSSITDKIRVCLWNVDPNGNIVKSFGIDTQLDSINGVTKNFNSFLDKMVPGRNATAYIDLNSAVNAYFVIEQDMVSQFGQGFFERMKIDVTSTTTQNPYVAIQDLNKYSDQESGSAQTAASCNQMKDYFVYDKIDCPTAINATGTIFANSTWTAAQSVNTHTCVPVIEMSTASLATRYTAFCASCSTECTSAKTKFAFIKNQDNSRREAYNQLRLALKQINDEMVAYNGDITGLVSNLNGVAAGVNSFVQNVVVLMTELNCTFLYTDLSNLIDALCVAFVPSFVNIVKLVGGGAICFFFSAFFGFMSAMKISKQDQAAKVQNVSPQGQQGVQMTAQMQYVPVQPVMVVQQQQGYPMAKY